MTMRILMLCSILATPVPALAQGFASETPGDVGVGVEAGVLFPDRYGTLLTVFRWMTLDADWSGGARLDAPLSGDVRLEFGWTRAAMDDVWVDGRSGDVPIDLVWVAVQRWRTDDEGETWGYRGAGIGAVRTRRPGSGIYDLDPALVAESGSIRRLGGRVDLRLAVEGHLQFCGSGGALCEAGGTHLHATTSVGLRLRP